MDKIKSYNAANFFVCLDRLSEYCASSPSHNLKWLFFRLFPRNSYHRGRGHDLLKGEEGKKIFAIKIEFLCVEGKISSGKRAY